MGTIGMCPIQAALDELYDWYSFDPWQRALTPNHTGIDGSENRQQPTAQESVRDIIASFEHNFAPSIENDPALPRKSVDLAPAPGRSESVDDI